MKHPRTLRRLRTLDWEAMAGVSAAVVALVLHLLHVVDQSVLLTITLVILALILIRDLRREGREEHALELAERTDAAVLKLQSALTPPDTILIGPSRLRAESEQFPPPAVAAPT
jgi:Flp pilus assembly protein TadB